MKQTRSLTLATTVGELTITEVLTEDHRIVSLFRGDTELDAERDIEDIEKVLEEVEEQKELTTDAEPQTGELLDFAFYCLRDTVLGYSNTHRD